MGKTKTMQKLEELERKRELARTKAPTIEVVGRNVAPPPKKWKVKRTSSGKSIEIYQEE